MNDDNSYLRKKEKEKGQETKMFSGRSPGIVRVLGFIGDQTVRSS